MIASLVNHKYASHHNNKKYQILQFSSHSFISHSNLHIKQPPGVKKGVLRNFTKSTEKHLYQSLF